MARQNKKGKHGKKRTRINKRKLILVVVGLLIVAFSLFKVLQTVFSGISVAKENVGSLITAVFGAGEDTSKVNKEKQFDLEDEGTTEKKKYVVYIDVGHGGTDVGYKTSNGVLEKDLDLQISKLVSSRLSSQGDISVVVSRNTDTTLSNSERVEDANKQNANLFVSIHMTGNEDSKAEGVQTFYRVEADDASDELATLVQKSVSAYVDLKDRGVTPFTFDVLQGNNMPSILIQCGFLSNPKEEKKLINPEFQKDLAEGIYQGILSFLDAQG
ncbi:N-acetylmuramoyl-L-alanine amidase family protein [Terrisporobacter vanillatitrophus]|uniref:N-acetylmuramoyl-L-alanine amidase family protein n=1 Tax=Terrisporobacter vanillatitrophus TaxID=3058402 RepID=UPI003365FC72